jgi:hypothetical protein
MAYKLAFGSYVFPAGFKPVGQDSAVDIAEQERPLTAGSLVQAGRTQSRKLQITGAVMGTDAAAIQATIDEMRQNVRTQGPGQLWFGRDDRYILAQCVGLSEEYASGGGDGTEASMFGVSHAISLSFVAGWPYYVDAAGSVTATFSASGGTITLATASDPPQSPNAPAFGVWTLTIATAGTGTIVLTNTTTSEAAILTGTFAASDTLTLTRLPQSWPPVYQASHNGTVSPQLMTGIIPHLEPGANVITTVVTGGVGLSGGEIVYTPGWLS